MFTQFSSSVLNLGSDGQRFPRTTDPLKEQFNYGVLKRGGRETFESTFGSSVYSHVDL